MSWHSVQYDRVDGFTAAYGWSDELVNDLQNLVDDVNSEVFGFYEYDESQEEKSQASALLQEQLGTSTWASINVSGWSDFKANKNAPGTSEQEIPTGETAAQYAERLITTVADENGWSDAERTYALLGIDAGEDAERGTASVDDPEFWAPVRDNLRSYVYTWPQGWEQLAEAIEALHDLKKFEDEKIENALKGAADDLVDVSLDVGKIGIGLAAAFLIWRASR